MKIGIVRHFKVNYKAKSFMNYRDFEKYIVDYDEAEVIENVVDLGNVKWDKCFCSDISRAINTAKAIYGDEIITSKLLREVNMYPIKKLKIKIPTFIWCISSRVAWNKNKKSQLEGRATTEKRAKEFIKKLDFNSDENILIVSHGFFLLTLLKELRKLGFNNYVPKKIENGKLYVIERGNNNGV